MENIVKVLKASLEVKTPNPTKTFEEMGVRPRNTRMRVNNDNLNGENFKRRNSMEVGNDIFTYCHRKNHNNTNCFLRLGTCYNCSKGGHLSYECRQKKSNYNRNGTNNYRRE